MKKEVFKIRKSNIIYLIAHNIYLILSSLVFLLSSLLFLSSLIFLLAASSSVNAAEATASSCGEVSSSLTLTANVEVNGTCFEINGSNLRLDCGGFTAYKNSTATGYGVNISNFINVTVKNCVISNFTNGIRMRKSNSTTIYNNTIVPGKVNNGYGIYLISLSNSNNITANNISTSGGTGYGVYLDTSSFNTIHMNVINNTVSGSTDGVYMETSDYNLVSYNNITTDSSGGGGITLFTSSDNNNITNNIIKVYNSAEGIWFSDGSDNNRALYNTVLTTSNSADGIRCNILAGSQIISFNTVTTTAESSGISLSSCGGTTLISYNNVTSGDIGLSLITSGCNCVYNNISTTGTSDDAVIYATTSGGNLSYNLITTVGDTSNGISFSSTMDSTVIYSNTIKTNGTAAHGIYFTGTSDGFNISLNNITTANATAHAIYFNGAGRGNSVISNTLRTLGNGSHVQIANTDSVFYNNTFNKSNIYFNAAAKGNITVVWYVTINITNSTGNALASANVSAYNSSSLLVESRLTGSTGILQYALTEFYQNSTSKQYHTPHSINASLTGYTSNSTTINLTVTESTSAKLSLTFIQCGQLSSSLTLINSLNATGTCFQASANNIVLDCAGNAIIGDNRGYGINISNFTDITIKNCILRNFTTGIRAVLGGNHSFRGNTINTTLASAYGIELVNSSQNTIYNNTILTTGSSANGIQLTSLAAWNNISSNNVTAANGAGVYLLVNSANNIITGNILTTDDSAVSLDSSPNNNLSNNNITLGATSASAILLSSSDAVLASGNRIITYAASSYGISIASSSNATLLSNTITSYNESSLYITGALYYHFNHSIAGNTADGKALQYYFNQNNLLIANNNTLGLLYAAYSTNITLVNITISDADGIYFAMVNDSTISASSLINTSSNGVELYTSNNNTVSTSVITSRSNSVNGVYITTSAKRNNVVKSNITTTAVNSDAISIASSSTSNNLSFNTLNTTGTSSEGIYISSSDNAASGNTITINGGTAYGVLVYSASSQNLTNNIITVYASASRGGITSSESSNINIIGNTITDWSNQGYGIELTGEATLTGINATANTLHVFGSSGRGISLTSTAQSVFNQNIINTTNTSTPAFYLNTGSSNNRFNGNVMLTNATGSSGIFLDAGINNTFTNDAITAPYANHTQLSGGSGIFINVTLNRSKIFFDNSATAGNLSLKWYVTANATDTNAAAISSANVTAYNSTNQTEASGLTDSSGIVVLALEEYFRNATTTVYATPHTLNATRSSDVNTTSLNLSVTGSTTVRFTLPAQTVPSPQSSGGGGGSAFIPTELPAPIAPIKNQQPVNELVKGQEKEPVNKNQKENIKEGAADQQKKSGQDASAQQSQEKEPQAAQQKTVEKTVKEQAQEIISAVAETTTEIAETAGENILETLKNAASTLADLADIVAGASSSSSLPSGKNKPIITRALKESESIPITVAKQDHTLTVGKINSGSKTSLSYVELTLQSEPIILKLFTGETVKVDLNKDKIDDLSITLMEVTNGSAVLKLIDLITGKVSITDAFNLFDKLKAIDITKATACVNVSVDKTGCARSFREENLCNPAIAAIVFFGLIALALLSVVAYHASANEHLQKKLRKILLLRILFWLEILFILLFAFNLSACGIKAGIFMIEVIAIIVLFVYMYKHKKVSGKIYEPKIDTQLKQETGLAIFLKSSVHKPKGENEKKELKAKGQNKILALIKKQQILNQLQQKAVEKYRKLHKEHKAEPLEIPATFAYKILSLVAAPFNRYDHQLDWIYNVLEKAYLAYNSGKKEEARKFYIRASEIYKLLPFAKKMKVYYALRKLRDLVY